MGYHILLWIALVLPMAVPAPARAQLPALLDPAVVPHLSEEGRADYARFLLQATPRAFALSPEGSWGWAAAQPDMATTEARALELCAKWGGQGCRLYARDLQVVWSHFRMTLVSSPPE